MTATTIRQIEDTPDTYPDPPAGLSEAAAALDPALIWGRIEAYTAWRFSPRDVTWTVEGCGEWCPPLKPATIATTESWNSADAWEALDLRPSPFGGYILPGTGQYRVVGTVGTDDEPPPLVLEAYRRLAEYLAAKPGKPGVRSESVTAGSVSLSTTRSPTATAEALQNSGAGDLLRSFRR